MPERQQLLPSDQAVSAVVEHDDDQVNPFAHRGQKISHRKRQSAVANASHHGLARPRERDNHVLMTGPVAQSFTGTLDESLFRA
jgi:hypothetical protein